MREKEIEEKLRDAVKRRGGLCLKFVSPGNAGVPDRIILMPERRIAFVEVKAPGEKPRKLQKHWHRVLRRFGFQTFVLDSMELIPVILDTITAEAHENGSDEG